MTTTTFILESDNYKFFVKFAQAIENYFASLDAAQSKLADCSPYELTEAWREIIAQAPIKHMRAAKEAVSGWVFPKDFTPEDPSWLEGSDATPYLRAYNIVNDGVHSRKTILCSALQGLRRMIKQVTVVYLERAAQQFITLSINEPWSCLHALRDEFWRIKQLHNRLLVEGIREWGIDCPTTAHNVYQRLYELRA